MLYKEGTFGYWWTVIKGNKDINGKVYKKDISCIGKDLISLEGCPKEVKGCFDCSDNNFEILTGAPEKVGNYFDCSNNKLTSLEDGPKEVKGSFWCTNNNLTTLAAAPEKVGKNFDCKGNKSLKDASDIFVSDIQGKFECDIMTDGEYKYGRELYLKLKDLDKAKKIYKLKAKMR